MRKKIKRDDNAVSFNSTTFKTRIAYVCWNDQFFLYFECNKSSSKQQLFISTGLLPHNARIVVNYSRSGPILKEIASSQRLRSVHGVS